MPIPKLIVTVGLMAAQVALGMTRKIKGPRLDELNVTVADYGTPIPRFWGIRRFNTPIMFAEKLREVKKTSKTKGGKYTEYKYYGTWANLICDQEIDAVRRIWFDKHLVFQIGDVGPIAVGSVIGDALANAGGRVMKLGLGKNMRFYLGTESQLPDPRMEAWCEDRYGADSCPAYRGSSYVMFEEIPLEKLGNHVPQVTIEAVRVKTASHPYELRATAFNGTWTFRNGYGIHWTSWGEIEWWDTASRVNLGTSPAPGVFTGSVVSISLDDSGRAWFMSTGNLWVVTPMGVPQSTATNAASLFYSRTVVLNDTAYTAYADTAGYLAGTAHVAHSLRARDFCIDDNDAIWILFQPDGSSDSFTIETLSGGTTYTFTGSATRLDVTDARFCFSDGNFFVDGDDGYFYIIDASTGLIVSSGARTWTQQPADLPSQTAYGVSFWDSVDEYSLADGSKLQDNSIFDWVAVNEAEYAFDPVTNASWSRQTATLNVYIRYLDRISGAGVTLGTIVDEVSDWCGLTGQDTSQLTQVIDGYSVTQGSGKDMLAPLLDVHDVDARPHDFAVQFVNRGSAPSGSTILTEDFVRDGDSKRYTVTIQQDTDIPRRVTVNFADSGKDQQTNTAIAQRPLDAVDSYREETIDLSTYVATPNSAQRLVERYFRRLWNSRERPKLSLTAQHLDLEPGDVKTISLDGVLRNVRLDKMTLRGSVLDCEWVRDETAFAVLNTSTGAEMEGRDDEGIYVPGMVAGFVLDVPLLADSHNDVNSQLYYAAGAYAGNFAGAVVYRGDDGTYDETFAYVESTQGATFGTATSALATANANLWDRGNTLDVNVFNGTLTSATEADINANTALNLIALESGTGWELIQFATATLTGTNGAANTYTLSGFKRGRRGTEGYVSGHAEGDRMLVLSGALRSEMGADDLADALSFKVQSVLRDVDAATAIDLTYTAATLKPYAPARVKWTTDGTDMFGEIIRRTRVGGAWSGGSTIPLSENSEDYEVDIMSGATVLRTITVSGTNTFTYTGAQITADGGSVGVPPDANVYQLSDAVGRGFALAA
jgi:hypothetical protein